MSHSAAAKLIKNYDSLATTRDRRDVLGIAEAGLRAVQPEAAMKEQFILNGSALYVDSKEFNLDKFENIYLIGFGKGSAGISKIVERELGSRLSEGYVIDTVPESLKTCEFTLGTHPFPSEGNYRFASRVMEKLGDGGMTDRDLVLVPVCGGGSSMFFYPNKIGMEKKIEVSKAMIRSGADIYELNTVRKHLSKVKGGGLARALYPATVVGMIFSDVPGNDKSFIASGPTVRDMTTVETAWGILKKYGVDKTTGVREDELSETPKDGMYFERVHNSIVLSNQTALLAMKMEANKRGYRASIYTDRFQGEARESGKILLDACGRGSILLAGGETTVKVTNEDGRGGRNQEVVLGALEHLGDGEVVASFGSDGWDFDTFAGAIGDGETKEKARPRNLDFRKYLDENNSTLFFEEVGDGILTGRLPSNVSDLYIVMKK